MNFRIRVCNLPKLCLGSCRLRKTFHLAKSTRLVAEGVLSSIKFIPSSFDPVRECRASAALLHSAYLFLLYLRTDYADLAFSLGVYRSVPTEDEILVPETLLKKRKSQEKAREERSAELEKKKKVSSTLFSNLQLKKQLWTWAMVMKHTNLRD